MDIDPDVIKNAYGWTISADGEVMALTSGDVGYELTGIVLEGETLKIWQLGVEQYTQQAREMSDEEE